MNKLILFNEPVKSVRKSQQTIHLRIGMILLQLFSSHSLIQMNRLERVFSELNSQVKNRARVRNWCCEKWVTNVEF